jgi:hypothetical protein
MPLAKQWRKSNKRLVLLGLCVAALAVVIAHDTGVTGAFFNDSHNGKITGTVGSIRITPSGGEGPGGTNFAFSNLLPGEPQTAHLVYENTGTGNEDVWIVFNNETALSALNNLGTYGEVHLAANGSEVFGSANLNDNETTCGPFSSSGCWPLQKQYKVASNVAHGGSGSIAFTFGYSGKLKAQAPEGTTAAFNPYPIPGQFKTNAADGSGNGLPYQIVATQVGQTP